MNRPGNEIDELIGEEKRQALAFFDAHPFEAASAVRSSPAPVAARFAFARATALVAAVALAVTAVFVTVRGPWPTARTLRVETVERALRGAATVQTPEHHPAPGGLPHTDDLARTVEAALWRGRGRTSDSEVERIILTALGGRTAATPAERPVRLDGLGLERRIERLRSGLLEDLLRRHWSEASSS